MKSLQTLCLIVFILFYMQGQVLFKLIEHLLFPLKSRGHKLELSRKRNEDFVVNKEI